MKKTLFLFLSVLMLISALSFVAMGASTINLVDVDGIVPPTVGASPNWDIDTNDTVCEVVHVEWFDHERGVNMQHGDKFLAERSYRLQIYVEPVSGWEFRTYQNGDVFTAILSNGEQIDDFYCIYGDKDELLIQIDYDELPAAESNTIDEIVLFIDQPVTGEAPSFRKVDATKYYSDGDASPKSNGITWCDDTEGKFLINKTTNAQFKCGHTYSVAFSLIAKGDYEFGNAAVKLNGKAAELTWHNPYSVTVRYTFAALPCVPEYVQGEFPTCNGNGHVGYYACDCGKWYWDAGGTEPIEDKAEILLPPTGAHTYETTVKTKATLSDNGKTVEKCSCGDSKTTTIYSPKTFTLSATEYTYNKKTKTPTVTVKDRKGNTLKKDTDYTVSYEDGRKLPGKYTVKITFKGKYEGTKRLYFTIAPRVTSKISASQTTSTITLKWEKVTGADGYRVYKYNSKSKKYEKLKDVTKTTLKISDLKAGTKYKYKVRAYTKDDGTIYGDYSKVFETATKCKTPSITKLSTTKGKASYTWSNVSGESGYQVYYSTKKDSGYKKVDSYKANKTSGTMSKLTSGKTYYFKVRAYTKTDSGTVYSSWSAIKSIKIK